MFMCAHVYDATLCGNLGCGARTQI